MSAFPPHPRRHPARRRPGRPRGTLPWAWHLRTLVALRNHLIAEQEAPNSADKFDRDFIQALLAREADPLGEINAAIDRILLGEYGRCEITGRDIPPERLRAAPWTRRTAD